MKLKKILFTLLSLVSIIGYGYFVYAAAPTGGYGPGDILDPACAPGDVDCVVALPTGGSVTADNGLTATSGNVQLGGVLTQQTIIDATNNLFGVGMDISGPQQTAFIIQQPVAGIYTTGIETMYVDDLNSPTIGRKSTIGTVSLPGGTASFMGWEDLINGDSYNTNISDNGISLLYKKGTSSGPADIMGLFLDETALKYISNSSYSNYAMMWQNWNGSGYESLATLGANGDWQWYTYPNTRDDSSTTNPTNFLYTDDFGNILSAPTSLLGGGSGWGLTGNSGTDADVDFIGTTDAQDFVIKTNSNEIARFGQNYNLGLLNYNDGVLVGPDANGNSRVTASGAGAMAWGGSAGNYDYPLASGVLSTAWGLGTKSTSWFTTAWGDRTSATEENATAFGTNTWASGTDSTAWGEGTIASGNTSTAFGQAATASGRASTAFGNETIARSVFETAFGASNTDYTPLDTSYYFNLFDRLLSIGNGEGFGAGTSWPDRHNAYTLWKDGSFAYNDDNFQNDNTGTEQNMFYFNYGNHDGLGSAQTKRAIRLGTAVNDEWDINSANVGDRSIAIGFGDSSSSWNAPIATGTLSMAFGTGAQATGYRATALGYFNKASGISAFAAGNGAEASGYSSVSIGYSSISSGLGSFAANSANASGDGSFAANQSSAPADSSFSANRGSANSPYSAAFGYDTDANGNYSFAGGSNSTAYGPNSFAFGLNAKAFSSNEIALGVENTSYTPTETVSDRLLVVGNDNSDAFTILKNGKTGIGYDNFETTALTALLQVNGDIQQTGATSCTLSADSDGVIICTPSDENLKTNINNITYGLDTISALRPVTYTFRDVKYGIGNQVGFLAQELEQIIPEVVTNGPDYKSVNYGLITPVIVKAIQEMNLNIIELTNTERPNTWRDSLIAWFGNVENGITKIYADVFESKQVKTETLCVGASGNETCITKDQLDQLLQGQNVSVPVIIPSVSNSDTGETSVSGNTSTETSENNSDSIDGSSGESQSSGDTDGSEPVITTDSSNDSGSSSSTENNVQ